MTPMVDLGFLLIAFFVMTAEMNKPVVTKLNMPKQSKDIHSTVRHSNLLNFLISKGKMYYYIGDFEEAKRSGQIYETSFSLKDGIGKVIRERQAWLDKAKTSDKGRNGLVFLIKPGPEADYQQVVDAIDEMQINNVKTYMIVSPDVEELAVLGRK